MIVMDFFLYLMKRGLDLLLAVGTVLIVPAILLLVTVALAVVCEIILHGTEDVLRSVRRYLRRIGWIG